jgi:hypothetical protein
MEGEKKNSYRLPIDFCMGDMCHCMCDCKTECARKKPPVERYYTASDFSKSCADYVPADAKKEGK